MRPWASATAQPLCFSPANHSTGTHCDEGLGVQARIRGSIRRGKSSLMLISIISVPILQSARYLHRDTWQVSCLPVGLRSRHLCQTPLNGGEAYPVRAWLLSWKRAIQIHTKYKFSKAHSSRHADPPFQCLIPGGRLAPCSSSCGMIDASRLPTPTAIRAPTYRCHNIQVMENVHR